MAMVVGRATANVMAKRDAVTAYFQLDNFPAIAGKNTRSPLKGEGLSALSFPVPTHLTC